MAEFDHGIKLITDTAGRELARLAGVEVRRLQPLESTLPATTELLADRAFRASRGRERFVIYFEFYTHWDRNAPWDLLAKSGLLAQRERLPVACLVFVLLRRGFRSQGGQLRLEAAGQPTQQLWFREVCLWELEPEAWWEDVPGLMALFPLCRHGRAPREAIQHAARAIETVAAEPTERADKLILLDIFGGLAYPRLDVAAIIGRDKMRGSRFLHEVEQEKKTEGAVEQQRAYLLKVVRARFGDDVAVEVTPQVNALVDVGELERLFDEVLRGTTLDEFRRALRDAVRAGNGNAPLAR